MFEVGIGAIVLMGMLGFILIGAIGWGFLPINPGWKGGVLAGVIGFILFSTVFVSNWYGEVDIDRYNRMTLYAADSCRVRPIFAAAMKDGILSNGEYRIITDKIEKMRLVDARKRAVGTAAAQCPVQPTQGVR